MLGRFLGAQLRHPSGRFGRVMGPLLNRANAAMNRRAIELLEVRDGQRVLEIGFGGGGGIERVRRAAEDVFVAGIELSETMLRQQRARFSDAIARGQVQLEQGSVERMAFDDAVFDRVLSVNTIYFWPSASQGLAEIFRVMAPGGRLVLGCTLASIIRHSPVTQRGFTPYGEDDVRGLLAIAGFSRVVIERPRWGRAFYASAHRPR